MFGFLRKWVGGETGDERGTAAGDPLEYQGFTITPEPYRNQGQWQLAARITKEIGGELREHHLVRADLVSDPEEARRHAVMKAQRLIDERGDGVFD